MYTRRDNPGEKIGVPHKNRLLRCDQKEEMSRKGRIKTEERTSNGKREREENEGTNMSNKICM
jgi:hypothetical protein